MPVAHRGGNRAGKMHQHCATGGLVAGGVRRVSPQQAQAILWNACPDPQYVVDVAIGSNHSRGTAIDVTLMDDRGHLLDMGAGFDEMHDRSHAWHPSVLRQRSVTACCSMPLCLVVVLSVLTANGGILNYLMPPVTRCLTIKYIVTLSRL